MSDIPDDIVINVIVVAVSKSVPDTDGSLKSLDIINDVRECATNLCSRDSDIDQKSLHGTFEDDV